LGWRGDLAKETSEQNYTQKYMVEMVEPSSTCAFLETFSNSWIVKRAIFSKV